MSRFTILLDGPLQVTERLLGQVMGSRVIAADGGIRHAEPLGLEVELWMGDFDSAEDHFHGRYASVPCQTFPRAKNMTDGELAISESLKRGAENLILAGALGGRSDHALCLVMASLDLAERGISVLASSGTEEALPLLPGRHKFDLPLGSGLSVIALSALTGLSLQGLQWPLDNYDIKPGSSLTLSNQVTGSLRVILEEGRGVIFVYPPTRPPTHKTNRK